MNNFQARQLVDHEGTPTGEWQFICKASQSYTPVGYCMMHDHKHESAEEAFICFLSYCLQYRSTIDKLDEAQQKCVRSKCQEKGKFLVTIYPFGWSKLVCKKHLKISELISLFLPEDSLITIKSKYSAH